MKYLRLFDNQTDYDNEKNKLILPSASLIEENNKVEYSPHQYVEINGVKWATMNVGAKSITDYGYYFQWGDTKGYTADQIGTGADKKKFAIDYSDYDADHGFKKYNTKGMTLALEDDAVHANWGGSWRMPTSGDFKTLGDAVTTEWATNYQGTEASGMVVTDKNDSSKTLFFPACGGAENGNISNVGIIGNYWSSSFGSNNVGNAYLLYFINGYVFWNGTSDRGIGCAMRGVWDDKLANQS